MGDEGSIRASDAERHATLDVLAEHASTGRLTLVDLEERAEKALRAVNRDELAQLTSDLPAAPEQPRARRPASRWVVSVMGGSQKRGRWRVGERLNAVTVMGGAQIDLREAELDGDVVVITVVALMGGVEIYLPDSVEVDLGGFALMGGTETHGSTRPARAGAPLVRIRAFPIMGGVEVWRLPANAAGLPVSKAKSVAKHLGHR